MFLGGSSSSSSARGELVRYRLLYLVVSAATVLLLVSSRCGSGIFRAVPLSPLLAAPVVGCAGECRVVLSCLSCLFAFVVRKLACLEPFPQIWLFCFGS